MIVRAPASTANLGPGFDCAAAALELWNELHVEEGAHEVVVEGEGADELPTDARHLALRAFALLEPPERYRFRFVNRIPLERGLGSSAAAIAAGLVAGAAAANRLTTPDELLELGVPLEGHPDNLAAALRGGVCLIWRNGSGAHAARIAGDLPLAPIIVAPRSRVNTLESRARLPATLPHAEAAAAAAQAALLGAAIAASDPDLLAAAFHDRLHEPFRLPDAPLLEELHASLPLGAAGVTLSGSGPAVVVWAGKERAASVASELESRFPDAQVLWLRVADQGAAPVSDQGAAVS
ncbi:MAG TPA: homoserine kinase [Gaiellaceae bacterium]|nr:homoserine kinase [Gaiellaceae bacterium]